LLTEHLRYTPLSLVDDIINTVNELSSRAVDAAEEGLLAADPAQLGFSAAANRNKGDEGAKGREAEALPDARVEIEEGVHQLETLLEANIDRNFDKFEIIVLRNILAIHPPELVPWIRLPHYDVRIPPPLIVLLRAELIDTDFCQALFSPAARDGDMVTPEALHDLRRRVREARKLNRALKATVARNNATVRQLRSLMQPPPTTSSSDTTSGALAFLTAGRSAEQLGLGPLLSPSDSANAPPPPPVGPLETNASFALSQLPALRDLLARLGPRLESLAAQDGGGAPRPADESAVARERRLYVEAQARRAVRRHHHDGRLDGDGEASSSSEAFGGGRVVSQEELAALEALVDDFNRYGDSMET
jgi:kinetochore protein Mis12/MTW1